MKTSLKCAFVVALTTMATVAFAQKKGSQAPVEPVQEKSFSQQVYDDYMDFYRNGGIFEKLYLMTDKPYYSAGETLYFSGFLLHATMLTRFTESEFVYVELINPDGTLVHRVKVCATDRQFIGSFALSARLSSGKYTLRAYSRWMTNFDTGYFYTREIRIGNFIDDAILTTVNYDVEQDGMVTAHIRLSDQYSFPFKATQVQYRTVIDGRSRKGQAKTNANGEITIKFKPSENSSDGIELNVHANSRELSRFLQMPSFAEDFDVTFCPEGGNLIAGTTQIVAFKAVRQNGRSLDVTGKIFDDAGNFITEFSTEYKGMGRIVLRAETDRKYYAECVSKDGLTKRFDLPVASQSGVSLRVFRQVNGYMFMASVSPDLNVSDFVAVIHSRGAVMSIVEDISRTATIRNSDMFDGIAQISIVHRPTHKIVAERLFYVRDNRFAKMKATTSKTKYEDRDRVAVNFEVVNSEGKPAVGNFAMSVTDSNFVNLTDDDETIFSYLLLSSDLKGDIEDAGSYFSADGVARLDRLDLVMMTNGWRRYSLAAVLAHEHPRVMYPVEDSQRIMGSVFGLFGRVKKPSIVVMNPETKYVNQFELNESNNFVISGLDAFSTATYIVQALNKKGKDTTVRIKIESENYPITQSSHIREPYKEYNEKANVIPDSFLARARERYFAEGGERVIDIEEVKVVARRSSTPFFATGNTGSRLSGDLSGYGNVYIALSTFKELNVLGRTVVTRPEYVSKEIMFGMTEVVEHNNSEEDGLTTAVEMIMSTQMQEDLFKPEFYVNGVPGDIDDADLYDMKYVERLYFVDGKAAYMLGLSAPTGAVMMEVSREGMAAAGSSDAMARVVVRGCDKPEAFFKQKYTTPADRAAEAKDMRSTIAWEPLIRTDSLGQANVWFYTADRSGNYDMVVEGVTDDGEICRMHKIIEVEHRK